jgi:23S rRNA (adenine2503-C2)-methyltransferase
MKNTHQHSFVADIIADPYGFTYDEIGRVLTEQDARSIYALLYKNVDGKVRDMQIKDIVKDFEANKYIFELSDHKYIESVCIKRRTGTTVCVSTQVGCPVKCAFCESGKYGLIRNLGASEIVRQVIYPNERINRIAFMGIGEPLLNYDAIIKAIHILRDRNGLDFPTDGIAVSTAGIIKGLKKIREEHIKIQLVLSLHATTQEVRDYLMSGMRHNDIKETVKATLSYSQRHNRKLVVAYMPFADINDRHSDIKRLIEWFKDENVMVNLIEYNQTTNRALKPTDKARLRRIQASLESGGVETMIRSSRGRNIKAACGQLAAKYNIIGDQ